MKVLDIHVFHVNFVYDICVLMRKFEETGVLHVVNVPLNVDFVASRVRLGLV